MRKLLIFFTVAATAAGVWAQKSTDDLVLVEGGAFKSAKSNYHGKDVTVADFYIGRHEVTQKEWIAVMGKNPSHFVGDDLPVENVTWYDCVEYCNRRSLKEGLQPCYRIDKDTKDPNNRNEIDDIKWTVTFDATANGYRLPTEAEWEYAATGGQKSKSYVYSGSDDIGKVAWYWQNAGDKFLPGLWNWPAIERNNNKTKAVGGKEPNELGLHDMSGNVREWCWDWLGESGPDGASPQNGDANSVRVWKGGGWLGGDFCCEPSFRAGFEANGLGADQGFRVCRNKEADKP